MPVSLAHPVSRRSLALRPVAGFFDGFEALDTCHRETLRMLGELADLVAQLERTGADSRARRRAAAIDRHFSVTMRQHHEDEERHVFPPLAAGGDEATRHAVACLQQDHAWLAADWRELSPLVDAVACGLSWYDLDSLREGVEVFTALARAHVAMEESLIYPEASARMPVHEREAMNREMARRRSAVATANRG